MKTANKILLTAFIILCIGVISLVYMIQQGISGKTIHGTGEIILLEKPLQESFQNLELRNNLQVYITQENTNQVTIEAHENIARLVETEVKDGILLVSLSEGVRKNDTPKIHVSVTDLHGIDASRGVIVESANKLSGSYLSHILQAGAKSTLELDYDELKIHMRAGAYGTLSGNVSMLKINSSSGALLEASQLQARYCEIKTSMGTVNSLHVTEKLSGSVSQGAVVSYIANPDISELAIRGGGQLSRMNQKNNR